MKLLRAVAARGAGHEVAALDHRDPRTGRKDGIQVLDVQPDSVAAQHGLSNGDVIKSINGHKVTSVSGAIKYVKANANTTPTWVAVLERQGRDVTIIYNSPPPE